MWPTWVRESELETFRERYRILNAVEMFFPTLDKKSLLPQQGYMAVNEAILSGEMKLSLHPFFRYILRQYNMTPTPQVPNT